MARGWQHAGDRLATRWQFTTFCSGMRVTRLAPLGPPKCLDPISALMVGRSPLARLVTASCASQPVGRPRASVRHRSRPSGALPMIGRTPGLDSDDSDGPYQHCGPSTAYRWCRCVGRWHNGVWHCLFEDPARYLTVWDSRLLWYHPPPRPRRLVEWQRRSMAPIQCLLCRRGIPWEWTICDECWRRIRWGLWNWLCDRLESSVARLVWVFLY